MILDSQNYCKDVTESSRFPISGFPYYLILVWRICHNDQTNVDTLLLTKVQFIHTDFLVLSFFT